MGSPCWHYFHTYYPEAIPLRNGNFIRTEGRKPLNRSSWWADEWLLLFLTLHIFPSIAIKKKPERENTSFLLHDINQLDRPSWCWNTSRGLPLNQLASRRKDRGLQSSWQPFLTKSLSFLSLNPPPCLYFLDTETVGSLEKWIFL